MNAVKKTVVSTKNFVAHHKVAVTFLATAATCLALNHSALNQHNEFLKEHDLYDAYYTPENSY
jgi:hypothetical protein